jgi:uncharacterized protein (TIGR02391 family)
MSKTLFDLIPDADTVMALAPEELAFYVLQVARSNVQNGLMNLQSVIPQEYPGRPSYPAQKQADIEVAATEAWAWLENQIYIVPAPGINGSNGFRVQRRRARTINDKAQFQAMTKAAGFPKELLHTLIAERVWISIARGEYADAVFFAFRTVEEAVRQAGGYQLTDIGVELMRAAFNVDKGPLSDMKQPKAEREALAHLFAGAIGSYKNPHSHRTVVIADAQEAQEMVMLASHLLRIVDARAPTRL